jgi:hypothetical protein
MTDIEYRIEFQIQRCTDEDGDFVEIGFGSSGGWSDLDMCAHMVATAVQTGAWETEPGQPDPNDVTDAIERASRL